MKQQMTDKELVDRYLGTQEFNDDLEKEIGMLIKTEIKWKAGEINLMGTKREVCIRLWDLIRELRKDEK